MTFSCRLFIFQGMEEKQNIKYLREIEEYYRDYISALIDEIYVGVGIALGIPEKAAYKLAENNPQTLEKAGIFSSIFDKLKSVFKYKIPKFRIKPLRKVDKNNPMTPDEWDRFNKSIDEYWRKEANKITGDIAAKTFMVGKETAKFRDKKKPYQNKSLYQVVKDQFGGKMPDSIESAYKNYDFKNSEKRVLNQSLSNTAMYVSETNNDIKESIRKIVNKGVEEGKSNTEIASDLYWGVQKDEDKMNQYTAESLKRNWNRIANTEVASIHEAAILAEGEADAMESMIDPKKARYYVRTGGTCDWCKSKQGTIVRLIPAELASGIDDESLQSIGIKDANTDIAIWPGKNNVGRKQNDWLIATPAHPNNRATFTPIDLETEFYNPKTGDVERRQKKNPLVQPIQQVERPKDWRTPKKIGGGLVQVGNNVYEAVSPDDFNRKLEEWRNDRSRPSPISTSSPDYIRIFEAAK